ncbi:Aftiphilin [Orchesella cincta]|uniref:Aftiphilin n=1 Tax=Orchesella cincta TaxID=48709 RepID=A0A1D2N1L7_ORCCI|nr:Aftiphilin [Orchesella cincta]
MASTFPAAIANEPPPLDVSSEDEDSEEFRSHGLKLDVPSGEPTPVSTPFKRPITKSPEKTKPRGDFMGITDLEESDDAGLEIVTSEAEEEYYSPDPSPRKEVLPLKENGTGSPDSSEVVSVNGIDNEYHTDILNCELIEKESEQVATNKESTNNTDTDNVKVPISAYTLAAADNCDSTSNNTINDGDDDDKEAQIGNRDSAINAAEIDNDPNSLLETQLIINEIGASVKEDSCESSAADDTSSEHETKTTGDENGDNRKHSGEESTSIIPVNEELSEFGTVDDTDRACCTIDSTDTGTQPEPTSCVEDVTTPSQIDDDFEDDDFGAFQSIPNEARPPSTAPINNTATSPTPLEVDDDDDFGDFAQVPATTCSKSPPVAQASSKDTDDFADFQDCSFQSCDVSAFSTPPSSASDFTKVSPKIDSILKNLFMTDSSLPKKEIDNLRSIDSEISISKDGLWAQVQDFEGSQGLMFKWLNSLTDKHLLTSLNIDTSTIMYHEKWGTIEVPKFAASLVQSPLQPQSCNFTDNMHSRKEVHHTMVINNNNNIPEGMSCQEHAYREHILDNNIFYKSSTMSAEAQEILRQLPDLSYMRANTLVFPETSPSGL